MVYWDVDGRNESVLRQRSDRPVFHQLTMARRKALMLDKRAQGDLTRVAGDRLCQCTV